MQETRIRIPLWLLILASTLLGGCGAGSTSTLKAIEHVTVVDPVDGSRADQRVLIDGDRIVAVEPMSTPAEPIAERIDATGRYLIPGLWDMHVHFLYEDALTDRMAALFLDYGITSVRDTGGDLAQMQALKARMDADPAPEPNVFYAGPLLDGPFVVYDGGDPGRPKLGVAVPDVATATATVEQLADAGVDLIKIYELVQPDVFDALVSAARARGLPIAAHVPLTMTADVAGPKVNSMEHLRNLELACAANWQDLLAIRRQTIDAFEEGRGYDLRRELHEMQRIPAIKAYDAERCDAVLDTLTDTIQVPTLRLNTVATVLPFDDPDWPRALAELPASVQKSWTAQADRLRDEAPRADPTFSDWSRFLVGRLKAHGVPIGAGTDTPIGLGIPGWSLHTELAQLVDAGLTPQEALYAATVQPATFFHREDEMGRIAPGMRADLVLLDADPLERIEHTRRIIGVMLGGRWVR